MAEINTRCAVPADLKTLLRFEQGIISTERPFDPTLKEGKISYYDLKGMITAANVELAVAVANDKIVGSGYARIEDSKIYLKHAQHAYLGFMYVEPEYRGQGVNQKIIEHFKQWAISRNVTELRLEVYDENLPAIKAYEKFGFSKLLVQMRMGINDQP